MAHATARPFFDQARVREHTNFPIIDRLSVGERSIDGRNLRRRSARGPTRSIPRSRGIAIAFLSLGIVLTLLFISAQFILETRHANAQDYAVRIPIVIDGDAGFVPVNGVVSGTGSEADPYVISGWEVQLDSGSGITVSNTLSYFIISEVHVNGTSSASLPQYAVYLYNVSHGEVRNSLLNNTQYGVHVELSDNCSIHQNQIYSCNRKAVEMASCDHVNVVGNDVIAANGVMGTTVHDSVVSLNTFTRTEVAVSLADAANITIQQNRMYTTSYAVSVSGARDIVISGNNATDGFYGILLSECWNVNVTGNAVTRSSGSGMSTSGTATNITFIYNRIRNSMYSGYMVDGADGVTARENLFENNTVIFAYNGGGVTITSGTNMTFFHNDFVTNTYAQAQDLFGPENRWNMTYPTGGNYWSDYAGPDLLSGPLQNQPGSDGFGDVSYSIDSDSIDYYPLVALHYINNKPQAMFTVTPSSGIPDQVLELDGSSSSDPDSSTGDSVREWRWDFDGDGDFDTSWSSDGIAHHQYSHPGNYTAILEVRDSHGLASLYQVRITISQTAIPEFGAVLLPVAGLLAVVGSASASYKRRQGRT